MKGIVQMETLIPGTVIPLPVAEPGILNCKILDVTRNPMDKCPSSIQEVGGVLWKMAGL